MPFTIANKLCTLTGAHSLAHMHTLNANTLVPKTMIQLANYSASQCVSNADLHVNKENEHVFCTAHPSGIRFQEKEFHARLQKPHIQFSMNRIHHNNNISAKICTHSHTKIANTVERERATQRNDERMKRANVWANVKGEHIVSST